MRSSLGKSHSHTAAVKHGLYPSHQDDLQNMAVANKDEFSTPAPTAPISLHAKQTRVANSKETLVMAIKPGAIPEKPGILSP